MTIDLSNLTVNYDPFTPVVPDPIVATTQRLLEVCADMDSVAYSAAVRGLIACLVLFVWMGRVRAKLLKEEHEKIVLFGDKLLMTYIAMNFVIIIVKLLRAG